MTRSPGEPDTASASQPRFEESLARLEKIVHALEEGDLDLADSLGRYEEGMGLLRRCYDILKGAEQRIELLTGMDADGNPITRPLDEPAASTLPPEAADSAPSAAAGRAGAAGPPGHTRHPHPGPLPEGEGGDPSGMDEPGRLF